MASPTQWTWTWINFGTWWWREAWCAAVHGVAKSRTRPGDWTTTTKIKRASHSWRGQVTRANWLWVFPNIGGIRGATLADRQASLKRALAAEARAFLHPHYIGHRLVMWSWASHCPSCNLCSSSVKREAGPNAAQMITCLVSPPPEICARP